MHFGARRLLLSLALIGSQTLTACASVSLDVGYYWQSIAGHLDVVRSARPIDDWLAEPALDPKLRDKLKLVQEIRRFAVAELSLPDNGSYTRYTELKRPFVLWNIFATPELSMKLANWCFPIAGCISYRGYYSKDDAESFAAQLRGDGLDVAVSGVPAYSTLGWFDDPVLSSFIHYSETELARLIFHELAHQVLYVPGDTMFNESFATALEEVGVQRWLAVRADPKQNDAYRMQSERRAQFIALLKTHRAALEKVFASNESDVAKRQGKAAVFERLQSDYQTLRTSWGGWTGYDRWFAQKPSNPHLAAVATYTDAVPGFARLYAEQGSSLSRYFEAARELARLSKRERDQRLGLAPDPKPKLD